MGANIALIPDQHVCDDELQELRKKRELTKPVAFLPFPPELAKIIYDIGSHALAVYVVLLDHRNRKTGLAWPTKERITAQSGVSRAEVTRSLAKLQEHDWIRFHHRSGRATYWWVKCANVRCKKALVEPPEGSGRAG